MADPHGSSSSSSVPSQEPIRCVCRSDKEEGHMIECEECGNWLHTKCVGLTRSSAKFFPFICPHCIKDLFKRLSSISQDFSLLKSHLSNLQSSIESSIPAPVKVAFDSINSSLKVISSQLSSLSLTPSTAQASSHCDEPMRSATSSTSPSPPANNSFLSLRRPPRKPPQTPPIKHSLPLLPLPPHLPGNSLPLPHPRKQPLLPTPSPYLLLPPPHFPGPHPVKRPLLPTPPLPILPPQSWPPTLHPPPRHQSVSRRSVPPPIPLFPHPIPYPHSLPPPPPITHPLPLFPCPVTPVPYLHSLPHPLPPPPLYPFPHPHPLNPPPLLTPREQLSLRQSTRSRPNH